MPFDERGSGRRICYYYHFGGCTNEKDCPFSHAEVGTLPGLGGEGRGGQTDSFFLYPNQSKATQPFLTHHTPSPLRTHNQQVEISTLEYAYIRDADPLPRPNHARAGPRRPVAPPAQQQRHKDGSGSKDIGNNKAGPPPHPVGPRRSQRQGPPRRGARGGREQWKREQEQEQWNQQIEMLAMQVGGGTVVINEEAGGTPAVVDAQGVAWGYSPEGPVFLGPVVRLVG